MALNNNNNDTSCKCTTPEYEIVLNEQGPQGRQGEKGDAGFTPIISVKDNTASNYTLNILTQDGQITTPNLKANLPAGGATGQVLTKNSANQDDCSWQNLPNATTEIEGIARLATEADFEDTEDSAVSDTSIVTPALFNSEFEKQSANFVTTNTEQTIMSKKTFMSDVSIVSDVTVGSDLLLRNSIINKNTVDGINPHIIEHYPTSNTIIIGETEAFTSEIYKNLGIEIQCDNFENDAGIYTHRDGNKYLLLDSSNVIAGENITIDKTSTGITISSTGSSGGTTNYTRLTNKPQINGVELTGNKNGNDLGLANESEIEKLGNELNQLANDVTNLDTNKQNKLIAGRLINIDNNNISVPNVNLKNVEYINTDETLSYINYNDNSFNQIGTIDYAPYKDGLLIPVFNTIEPNAIKSFDFITMVKMGKCKYGKDRRIIQVGNGPTNFWFDTCFAENIRYVHFINAIGSGEGIGISSADYNNNYLAFRLKSDGTKIYSYYKVCTNNELPNEDDWNLVRTDSWDINSYPLTSDTGYSFLIAGLYSFEDNNYITSRTQQGKYFFNNTRLIVNGEVVFDGINSINTASKDNLGLVKIDGTTITNNSNGQLQVNLPDNLTAQGNTFNGASQLVQLDGDGKLPAIDGSQLTNLPTGNLKYWTGTEADYTGLATKDADTLYRTTDTNKVFLGTIQLGGNT